MPASKEFLLPKNIYIDKKRDGEMGSYFNVASAKFYKGIYCFKK